MEALNLIRGHVYWAWFSLLLFVAGFFFSYAVERYDLRFLKVFPKWMLKKTLNFANPRKSFLSIFLFIALFNSIAIFIYMLSGVFVIFPFIIAVLTGLNIGIILLQPIPPEFEAIFPEEQIEINPAIPYLGALLVPILELTVFSTSIAMGMTLGLSILLNFKPVYIYLLILSRVQAYLIFGVPILFISALLETLALKGGLRIRMK
ncbi:MAG: hypothetical protein NT030_05945 [Candidatus Saganbacteria bacterium]|nr:hypothetical protein [Candidatus Saganbacteria bacterium]